MPWEMDVGATRVRGDVHRAVDGGEESIDDRREVSRAGFRSGGRGLCCRRPWRNRASGEMQRGHCVAERDEHRQKLPLWYALRKMVLMPG